MAAGSASGAEFSPFEVAYFRVTKENAQSLYMEAFEVLMSGLTSETLNFSGSHFQYTDVPMVIPPLW